MYDVEPIFWVKLGFLIVTLLLLFKSFNALMSKWLKVERKKLFSYNYVNERHKKVDWAIRIIYIVLLIGFWVATPYLAEKGFHIILTALTFVFIFTSELVRAVMERKYDDNPRAYILTLSELGFMILVVFLVFATDFFGLMQ